MAGVLEFTLGLEVSGFLHNIGLSHGGIILLERAGEGLKKVYEGVAAQFERGISLEHLSKRSGESVKSLFELQRGFQAAGLSAEDVGPALWFLQKSLGGVNEFGQKTGDVFAKLGLHIGALKKMDAAGQFKEIFGALSKLNQSDAAKASSQLFGRGEGANMLQLSRSAEEVKKAMEAAAGTGELFERHASAMDRMRIMALEFKHAMEDAYADIAVFSLAMAGAFKEGKLGELLGETLKLAFDTAVAYAPVAFMKIGQILLKAFETPLIYLQAAMTHILFAGEWEKLNPEKKHKMWDEINAVRKQQQAAVGPFGLVGKWLSGGDVDGARKAYEEGNAKIAAIKERYMGKNDWKDNLQEAKEKGLGFDLGSGEFGMDGIAAEANAQLAKARKAMGPRWAEFAKTVEGFADKMNTGKSSENYKDGTGSMGEMGSHYKPEFTSMEKMGFVMSGLGNPMMEHARTTANATSRMAAIMEHQTVGTTKDVNTLVHHPQ